jgi:translation elongation factor EF-G
MVSQADSIFRPHGVPDIWQESVQINNNKMLNNYPVNFERIDEMAEGDADFRAELVSALFKSLSELKEKYLEGAELKDAEIISQIRHKVKPALELFEINKVESVIKEGKDILSEEGFSEKFLEHLDAFLDAVQDAIDQVSQSMNVEGN